MPTLHIRLLGELSLVFGDAPVTAVNTARLQSLLAYLVLHRDAPQSRQHVAFLLWPDSSEEQARTNSPYMAAQPGVWPSTARYGGAYTKRPLRLTPSMTDKKAVFYRS